MVKLRLRRSVGNKTRREIASAVKILRERLGNPATDPVPVEDAEEQPAGDLSRLSVDLLAQRLTRVSPREGNTVKQTVTAMLGLEESLLCYWPGQADVARFLAVTRARVGQIVSKVVDRWCRDKALTPLRSDIAGLLATAGGVMTAEELGEAILAARGSVQEGPQRGRLGRAAARAAVEVERMMAEPRYLVRRDDTRTLVAIHPALADYAARLGDKADELAREDPLAPPVRALQVLREVSAPVGFEPLADGRLLRLAAADSCGAAVSSRQVIYPRGLEALRVLRLARGALGGVRVLSAEQVRDRVAGRYPEADLLPERPGLDDLLASAGLELTWKPDALDGRGGYVTLPVTASPSVLPACHRRGSPRPPAVIPASQFLPKRPTPVSSRRSCGGH